MAALGRVRRRVRPPPNPSDPRAGSTQPPSVTPRTGPDISQGPRGVTSSRAARPRTALGRKRSPACSRAAYRSKAGSSRRSAAPGSAPPPSPAARMDSTHFSAAVRALAHAPPLEALGVATAAVLALILAVPALLVLRYTVLTAFNVFTDYFRLGRFGDLPRAKHTGTWTQSLRGDIHRILEMEPGDAHREFIKEAGSEVLLYRMLFWAPRLLLVDHGAILHILSAQQSYSFPKPHFTRRLLSRSLGDGILVVEGAFSRQLLSLPPTPPLPFFFCSY